MAGSTGRRWTLWGSLIASGAAVALVIGFGVLAGAGAAASLAQPVNITPPAISGTPQEGATLNGTRGTWGNSPTRYNYFWRRCNPNGGSCSNIGGARSLTYTLGRDDVGYTIRLRVRARNSDGSTYASSGQTALITAGPTPLPQNTMLPTIKGTPRQGQTLRGDQGDWTGSPTDYNDFWVRCDRNGGNCANIVGANNRNGYVLTSADVGHSIRFKVEARNAAGSTFASSVPTAVIVAIATPAPKNTSPPTITGSPSVGSVLTMRVGTWNGTQPITYRYQWLRCDSNGGGCAAIPGAVGTTWRILPASAGHRLRARVTATNPGGSTLATSTPTAMITGAASPAPPTAAGCPAGSGPVNINSIKSPARLLIDRQQTSPSVVHGGTGQLIVRYHVTACGGRSVQGALVYATAVPFNQLSIPPERTTNSSGWAELDFRMLAGFPVSSKQQLIAIFARARKPGENVLGGISTRRLFSVPVNLHT